MELRGHQASGVVRVPLVPEVSQGLQALDRKETEVCQEIQVFRDSLDLKDTMELLVSLGQQVLWVRVERRGSVGSKATEERSALEEVKVTLVKQAQEGCKVTPVCQDHQDQLETKDPKGPWVITVLLGPLESEVLPGPQEMQDLQESLDFKDLQGCQGIQELPVLKAKLVQPAGSSTQLDPAQCRSQDHPGLLVPPALQEVLDYQVLLAPLVFLVSLVLKVTEELREIKEHQV